MRHLHLFIAKAAMPLDRHARRFLEMLAAAGRSRGRYGDVEDRRRALTSLAELVDPPGTTPIGGVRDHLLKVSDGHITLRTYSPLETPQRLLPGMVFFHGGGWVAGNLETHDGFCRRLANETGVFFHGFPASGMGLGHWNEHGHRVAAQLIAQRLCAGEGEPPAARLLSAGR